MPLCETCHTSRAQILRPKTKSRLCGSCFTSNFEAEIAETILSTNLFLPGEKIAIGASGGKDSTVLASVLKTLNERHGWNLDLILLSIDEGIQGYRDHSLEAVKRNSADLDLPLKIISYQELYGWSMDQVVAQIGKKNNCTYCGVFRRQALDRGAAMLGVAHVVTGHNADDVAETVLMNLLRGDLPRLSRATSIVTSTPSAVPMKTEDVKISFTNVKRSKPLMYAYEKEIVLYAHHKKLDYFSTECIYSPEAFRGSARTLIKNLERIRPESILDIVHSGVDMAKLIPDTDGGCRNGRAEDIPLVHGAAEDEDSNACGSGHGTAAGGDMAEMEKRLRSINFMERNDAETEIKVPAKSSKHQPYEIQGANGSPLPHPMNGTASKQAGDNDSRSKSSPSINGLKVEKKSARDSVKSGILAKQKLGRCERCGYLSSQAICKACVLLEGLNKTRPRTDIEVTRGVD